VTPGRPKEQSSCHHLQRKGDEGEVEGPAQRALHPFGRCGVLVEQVHPGQEAADGAQRTKTCKKMEHSYNQGGGEAAAQAGADPQ